MYLAFNRFDWNVDIYKTEEEARARAREMLEQYRGVAGDVRCPEDFEGVIGWAKIIGSNKGTVVFDKKNYTDEEWEGEGHSLDFDKIVGYTFERISKG